MTDAFVVRDLLWTVEKAGGMATRGDKLGTIARCPRGRVGISLWRRGHGTPEEGGGESHLSNLHDASTSLKGQDQVRFKSFKCGDK